MAVLDSDETLRSFQPDLTDRIQKEARLINSQASERVVVSITTLESSEVEAVEVHDLAPCGHKIIHECFLCIITRVDFSDGSKLRIGAEN